MDVFQNYGPDSSIVCAWRPFELVFLSTIQQHILSRRSRCGQIDRTRSIGPRPSDTIAGKTGPNPSIMEAHNSDILLALCADGGWIENVLCHSGGETSVLDANGRRSTAERTTTQGAGCKSMLTGHSKRTVRFLRSYRRAL